MIYDLVVVGNGLAAQAFLFELFSHLNSDVKKYQNFSVAQIFSEEIAPACSLRSTASVSLSGITTGISELGDDLSKSFYLFEKFIQNQNPSGVEKVKQIITFSNAGDQEKLIRRYQQLHPLSSPLFDSSIEGVELDSYLVSPALYADWFNSRLSKEKIDRKKNFLQGLSLDEEGIISCELLGKEQVQAKKIVLCTGAYAKIFSQFYPQPPEFQATHVVAGAYLEKSIALSVPSFFITIDGHNLIYRNSDQTLIMGSASYQGALTAPDYAELKAIHELFSRSLKLSLGSFDDYKTVIGLRHKGKKRLPIAKSLNSEKSVYMINGFYKNGYSLPYLCAERIVAEIFSH